MTRVHITYGPDRFTVTAKGHATGSPEVCAAVSGLIYALAGFLQNFGAKARLEAGDAEVECLSSYETDLALEMAYVGFRQIAQQYPEYLQVETDAKEKNF